MILLAIESSCDDTSVAILKEGVVLSNVIATQKVHEGYGGVVPELASRAHLQHIIPTIMEALSEAAIDKSDIEAIAATRAPGLIGSLLVGYSFAKALAQSWKLPFVGVHHMKAHILAHWLEASKPSFPFLCLTVSGGHTQIVRMESINEFEIIGQTLDDAAGEAFDKIAKMLSLPYPGGPLIDKYAASGNPNAFSFSLPEIKGYDFSFSGLKTSVLYFLQKKVKEHPDFIKEHLNDLCASVQLAIVTILMRKLKKAAFAEKCLHVGVAGGVSANSLLRNTLKELGIKHGWRVHIPAFEYCTDNAAMVGIAAYYQLMSGDATSLSTAPMARADW